MAQLSKKYVEDFEKLVRDWKKLQMNPTHDYLNLVMQDLQQIQADLRNIKF